MPSQTPAPQQVTPDQAYDIIVAQVHAPIFFNKLASVYGIVPNTPQDTQELLNLASRLRNAHEAEQVKSAGARSNVLAEACHDIGAVLNEHGYPAPPSNHYQQHATAVASNPLMKEAALVFRNWLSQTQN